MKKVNDQTLQVIANILDTVYQRMESESNKQNRLGNHSKLNDDSFEECTKYADYPIQLDDWIVTPAKRELRPLLFERSLKRRAVSGVGTSFSP
jgi:hypothetical protein